MYYDPPWVLSQSPFFLKTNSFKTAPDFTADHMNMDHCSLCSVLRALSEFRNTRHFLMLHKPKSIQISVSSLWVKSTSKETFSGFQYMNGRKNVCKLSGVGGELTVAALLLQATQGVCCSPYASPVCPSCCSTSSIRLPSTASWPGTPSPLTSTVSTVYCLLYCRGLKVVMFVVYVEIKATCRLRIYKEPAEWTWLI